MRWGAPWLRAKSGPGLSNRTPRPPRFGGATVQRPGPDLGRMAIGLDLRGINLVEGIRAALASAVILIANQWIGSSELAIAAIAAQITCFCDVGGSVRQRFPWLVLFACLGAATWSGFGLLRGADPVWILPAAGIFVFISSSFRIWGVAAQAVGNLLTVVMALALDHPLSLQEAVNVGIAFIGGGAWAIVLMLAIWRINPDQPARRAIAETWRYLSLLAADLRDLAERTDVDVADWEGHAREHRRAIRDAIERTRLIVMDLIRSRGPLSQRGALNLIRLETADQLFGILLALSDLIEHSKDHRVRDAGAKLLRVLRPALVAVSRAILSDRFARPARIERAVSYILAAAQPVPELGPISEAIASRLRSAVVLTSGDDNRADSSRPVGAAAPPFIERALEPMRANLTWQSAIFRHAARAAVVAVPAVAFTLVWVGPYQHWLTITVILTMQPYFAATWQRALERTGGTALGAMIGAALAFFPQTPAVTAALLFPLAVIGFAARQVSYGAFIACLTPLIVVLVEAVQPGSSEWVTAGMRMLYTIAGGLLAIGSCLLLWPTWEPDRLRQELRATLLAVADWAEAVLSSLSGGTPAAVEQVRAAAERARAAAGVAHNNLEASLSRALQERRNAAAEGGLKAAIVADATLRRFGAGLMALQYDHDAPAGADAAAWSEWLPGALRAMAGHEMPSAPEPRPPRSAILQRMSRQIALLSSALMRAW